MIVDAHQHFWRLDRGEYPWLDESVAPIRRDFGPGDLAPLLGGAGVDRTILVQAAESEAETAWLLDLARQVEFVAGVVGWVDLARPDAPARIDGFAADPAFCGVRPMLQDIAETEWILRDELQPALAHVAARGLTFDALIQPRHLQAIDRIARRHPELRIVIDHLAKPRMGQGRAPDPAWREGMERLAARPNVWCKLSGMVTEVEGAWTLDDLRPFADVVLEAFGPRRIMFGSDWPVVNLRGDYAAWLDAATALIAPLNETERARILGGSAAEFYGIAPGG